MFDSKSELFEKRENDVITTKKIAFNFSKCFSWKMKRLLSMKNRIETRILGIRF